MILSLLTLLFGLWQVLSLQYVDSKKVKVIVGITAISLSAIPLIIQLVILLDEFRRVKKFFPRLLLHQFLMNLLGDYGPALNLVAKDLSSHPSKMKYFKNVRMMRYGGSGWFGRYTIDLQMVIDSSRAIFTRVYGAVVFGDAFSGMYNTRKVSTALWLNNEDEQWGLPADGEFEWPKERLEEIKLREIVGIKSLREIQIRIERITPGPDSDGGGEGEDERLERSRRPRRHKLVLLGYLELGLWLMLRIPTELLVLFFLILVMSLVFSIALIMEGIDRAFGENNEDGDGWGNEYDRAGEDGGASANGEDNGTSGTGGAHGDGGANGGGGASGHHRVDAEETPHDERFAEEDRPEYVSRSGGRLLGLLPRLLRVYAPRLFGLQGVDEVDVSDLLIMLRRLERSEGFEGLPSSAYRTSLEIVDEVGWEGLEKMLQAKRTHGEEEALKQFARVWQLNYKMSKLVAQDVRENLTSLLQQPNDSKAYEVEKVIRQSHLSVAFSPANDQKLRYHILTTGSQENFASSVYSESFFGHCTCEAAVEFCKLVEVLNNDSFVVKGKLSKSTGEILRCEKLSVIVQSILKDGKRVNAEKIVSASYV